MIQRLLIAGLGSIGSRHARVARALMPHVEIAALRRRDEPSNAPIDRVLTTVEDALAWRPQAAVVAGPSTLRLDIALPLARAATHLLVEKPIADRSDAATVLLEACRQSGAVLAVGYNLRHTAALRYFRDRLLAGDIGDVLSVRAEVGQLLPLWRPGVDYRRTVSARRALGGGVLRELSHEIDYLRWIFGEFEWVNAVVEQVSSLEIDVEDAAYLTIGLRSPSGRALTASLTMDFFRHDLTRTCVAIGARGSLRWNGIQQAVEGMGAGSSSWSTVFRDDGNRDASYVAEWRDFLDAIAARRAPAVQGRDGVEVLRLIEAAHESARTGGRVSIDPT